MAEQRVESIVSITVPGSLPAGVLVGAFLQAAVDSYARYIEGIHGTDPVAVSVRWLLDASFADDEDGGHDDN